jgi:hypothetical protein
LCCRQGDAVTVNLEYVIQLGAVAELAALGWTRERLRVELGEFDAACLDSDGSPAVLMEAKARVGGPDGLESLLRKWLVFSESGSVPRGRTPPTSTWSCSASQKGVRQSMSSSLRPERGGG